MENQFPLDFDALTKGQILDIEYLERIFGVRYEQGQRWAFLVMGLQAQVHEKTDLSCKIDHDAIRILTDAEASEHNFRLVGCHVRGISRRTEKLLQVDRSQLDETASSEHDRRIRVAAAYAGAVVSVRREIQGVPAVALPNRLERVQ
jgi:hypothetical protein